MMPNDKNKDKSKTPRPWDHEIRTSPSTDTDNGGGLTAYCTCGDYTEAYPAETDVLVIATRSSSHYRIHPREPVAIAQVGNGNVIAVMEVPGTGDDAKVHMSIAVPAEIWDDSARLNDFLGPIGSPVHFATVQERQESEHGGFHVIPVPMTHLGNIRITREEGEIGDTLPGSLIDFLKSMAPPATTKDTTNEEQED
jgi:hypothetical protein